ncbi:MAG: hypothetical protein RLY31_2551 [Bacteroidota bacterium]
MWLPLFLCCTTATASTEPCFAVSGCVQGDCRDGYGTFVHPNGDRYIGDFQDGQPHGKGILYARGGNKYLGDWDRSLRQGTGRMIFREGHVYTGAFHRDQVHGRGRMDFANGDRYEGDWQRNRPHGQGVYTYLSRDRYEGSFENGCFHGAGIFVRRDGTRIQGLWEKGRPKQGQTGVVPSESTPWVVPDTEPVPAAVSDQTRQEAMSATDRQPGMRVWAVVIGISHYPHMPALRYADDDAYRFYAFLRSPAGGAVSEDQVRLLVDEHATLEHIRIALAGVSAAAGPHDVLLVYYSGHGLEGAFVPSDFDGVSHLLPHTELRNILGKSKARNKVLISDACHAGSMMSTPAGRDWVARGTMAADVSRYYEALMSSGAGWAMLLSSRESEISLEDSSLRAGVFSHFLVRGLSGEADLDLDRLVSLQEIYNFVKAGVRRYSAGAQSPMLAGNYDPAMPLSVVLRP